MRFLKSSYIRNIAVVLSGTAVSQAILVMATPLLTRLYDPEAFGIFTLFISITLIINSISTWKYDLAVVLPKRNEEAASIFYLTMFIILFNGTLISIIIFFFKPQISSLFGIPELEKYLWWIPIFVLGAGFYTLFNNWNNRRKQYYRLSVSRVSRSVSQVTIQSLISKSLSSGGLIVGQVIGQLISSLTLGGFILRNDKKYFKKPSLTKMKKSLVRYRDFPLYNAPQHFLNSLTSNLAPFILAFYFGPHVVGLYAVSVRVLKMPITLISDSLGQVFYQKATAMYNNNESIYNILKKSTISLGLIFIIPWILLISFAPELFSIVLGNEWFDAGLYARWIAIWMFFVAINAPSVKSFVIFRMQKLQLKLNVFFFLIRISALIIGAYYFSPLTAIKFFVLTSVISNITIIITAFYFSKKHIKKIGLNNKITMPMVE